MDHLVGAVLYLRFNSHDELGVIRLEGEGEGGIEKGCASVLTGLYGTQMPCIWVLSTKHQIPDR